MSSIRPNVCPGARNDVLSMRAAGLCQPRSQSPVSAGSSGAGAGGGAPPKRVSSHRRPEQRLQLPRPAVKEPPPHGRLQARAHNVLQHQACVAASRGVRRPRQPTTQPSASARHSSTLNRPIWWARMQAIGFIPPRAFSVGLGKQML